MNTDKLKGFLYGLVTSVTFGLIPLFTLPLMQKGLASDSILFYRFITATLALGIVMLVKGESFRIHWKDVPLLIVMALFYTASSMFLLYGYEVMGAGVATTLHFTYPIFTTLLMLVLFREKASWVTWLAIVLAVGGVARLSLQGTSLKLDPWGVFIVLLSAVGYASYIVSVNKSRLKNLHSRKLAFYVFLFTALTFTVKNGVQDSFQPLPDLSSVGLVLLLAVAPTVISNITLLLAVRHIGGTLTSILGAMEPVTAVVIGACVFGEAFTATEAVGIALILVAVVLVILTNRIKEGVDTVMYAEACQPVFIRPQREGAAMLGEHLADEDEADALPVRLRGEEGSEQFGFHLAADARTVVHHFYRSGSKGMYHDFPSLGMS